MIEKLQLNEIKNLVNENPENINLLIMLSLKLIYLERYNEAVDVAKTIVNIIPESAFSHNLLGNSLLWCAIESSNPLKRRKLLKEAEKELRKAMEIQTIPESYFALAILLYFKKQESEAEEAFQTYLERVPQPLRNEFYWVWRDLKEYIQQKRTSSSLLGVLKTGAKIGLAVNIALGFATSETVGDMDKTPKDMPVDAQKVHLPLPNKMDNKTDWETVEPSNIPAITFSELQTATTLSREQILFTSKTVIPNEEKVNFSRVLNENVSKIADKYVKTTKTEENEILAYLKHISDPRFIVDVIIGGVIYKLLEISSVRLVKGITRRLEENRVRRLKELESTSLSIEERVKGEFITDITKLEVLIQLFEAYSNDIRQKIDVFPPEVRKYLQYELATIYEAIGKLYIPKDIRLAMKNLAIAAELYISLNKINDYMRVSKLQFELVKQKFS